MGGRNGGSRSSTTGGGTGGYGSAAGTGIPAGATGSVPPPQQNSVLQQGQGFVPVGQYNVPLDQLKNVDDATMAQILRDAQNVDMPLHLADGRDATQQLVYVLGYNAPPTVLDHAAFQQFVKDNNATVFSRSVSQGTFKTTAGSTKKLQDAQVAQLWISDPYNYIGGKRGGMVHGAGAYFDKGSGNTGYGSYTYRMAFNPKVARVGTHAQIDRDYQKWANSHPQAAREVTRMVNASDKSGTMKSVKALIAGYNVINGNGGYHVVINRDAAIIDGG